MINYSSSVENQNKKLKDIQGENGGNFQNILKLLTEQRSKIDEILVRTRNYQSSRQKLTRGGKEQEQYDDLSFLEDISGLQNGASQNVEELRKKIETLKKKHKQEVILNNMDSINQQQQITKKKNLSSITNAYKSRNGNFISPKKERANNITDNSKHHISNQLKEIQFNNIPHNQQRYHSQVKSNQQIGLMEESKDKDNSIEQQIKPQSEQNPPSSQNIELQNGNHQLPNFPVQVTLPPIQQKLNSSVDIPKRSQRSNSIQSKKYGNTFNREQLNKSDLGMQNIEEDDIYNKTQPPDNNYQFPNFSNNTKTVRMNTNQRNIFQDAKIETYQQKYKQQMKSNQIKKIYLSNPISHKVSPINYNFNMSPDKREFRETFMNDMNKNYFYNNISGQNTTNFTKLKKKSLKKSVTSKQKNSRTAILDEDIFNFHKNRQSIPSLDVNTPDLNFYNNNSQAILNTNYDSSLSGQIPQGLSCLNYYSDFEQLIARQSMETLNILDYVFESSKSKSKQELLEKLSEFKQNFSVHAEKQDKQIREIKKKYHHFRKFDLPKDFNLGNNTF